MDKELKGAAGEGKGKATEESKKNGGEMRDSVNYLKKAGKGEEAKKEKDRFSQTASVF
ncbi:MAG: hypothetical protein WCO26_03340 [Deltaproteobacteria bacterium]